MASNAEELFSLVHAKLKENDSKPKIYNTGALRSKCPCHGGSNDQSLHVQIREGKVLMHCHSGRCGYSDILASLGIDFGSSPKYHSKVDDGVRYIYKDENGKIIGSQLRRYRVDGKKFFTREKYDTETKEWTSGSITKELAVPYNLPEMIKAAEKGDRIWIVEGEKDVETLGLHGIVATAFMAGASGWLDSYSRWFRGTRVVICGDRDEPGQKFCGTVSAALKGIASEILTADLPYEVEVSHGKDVSDYLSNNSVEDLKALVSAPWRGPGIYTIEEALEIASEQQKVELSHYGMVGMGPGYDIPGIGPGKLIGVVARLSTGKTAWIVDLCCRCIIAGKRIMFVSYDETAPSIAAYLATSITGDYTYVTRDQEISHIRKAPRDCDKLKNVEGIIDGHVKSPSHIAATAFRHKPDVIFVDHLAKILPENPKDKDYKSLGQASAMLRKIANEGDCAVVAALQSNREGQNGLLQSGNVAGSDEIARDMDAVLGLQYPSLNEDDKRLNVKKLLKNERQSLDSVFKKPNSELGMRIRPSIRVINTVKSRMSKGGGIWPVIFYGAERRLFPVHVPECQCKECTLRMLTQGAHDYIVRQALYGDSRDNKG